VQPLKRKILFTTVTLLLLIIGLITATGYAASNQKKPFYVGVTYCGSSIEEAKELINKVKDYTNLFVLLSGPFMSNTEAMEEIGDYAIASKLNYAISSSARESVGLNRQILSNWLINAKERWGEQFIGIYYNDEPGGNMLDSTRTLNLEKTNNNQIHVKRMNAFFPCDFRK